MNRPASSLLSLTVFTTGASILALELLVSRIMTPAFGASIYIWGAVLSITMLDLAIGYAWGGRLADRPGEPTRRLVWHILLSAAWIGTLPLSGGFLVQASMQGGAYWGPILAAFLLLTPPLVLLATAVPLGFGALHQADPTRPGRFLGNLFGISTAGSIFGAMITAYLAIPALGTHRSLFFTTLALLLVSTPYVIRGNHRKTAAAVLVTLILSNTLPFHKWAGPRFAYGVEKRFETETAYGHIAVVDDHRDQARLLLMDGTSQNFVYGDEFLETPFEYIPVTLRVARTLPSNERSALVLGLGAGTMVRRLHNLGFEVDVVEIDPALVDVAATWFGFDPDSADLFLEDGRTFLNRARANGASYGLIVFDVASGAFQPTHLYNRDVYRMAKSCLSRHGKVVLNVLVRTNPVDRIGEHGKASFAEVFPAHTIYNLLPDIEAHHVGTLVMIGQLARTGEDALLLRYPRERVDGSLRPLSDSWNPAKLWAIQNNWVVHQNIRAYLGDAAIIPL